MAITVSAPRVSSREVWNPRTQEFETKWQVCVTVENDTDDDANLCIWIGRQYDWGNGREFQPECRRRRRLSKRMPIVHPLGSTNGVDATTVCCDLPGEPQNGTDFSAYVQPVPCDRERLDTNAIASASSTYRNPRSVSALPGEKLRFSILMGNGLESSEGVQLACVKNLPVGWKFEFEGVDKATAEAGEAPFDVVFAVTPRPGAYPGEYGEITMRASFKHRPQVVEERTVRFAIKEDRELIEPPAAVDDPCDCA